MAPIGEDTRLLSQQRPRAQLQPVLQRSCSPACLVERPRRTPTATGRSSCWRTRAFVQSRHSSHKRLASVLCYPHECSLHCYLEPRCQTPPRCFHPRRLREPSMHVIVLPNIHEMLRYSLHPLRRNPTSWIARVPHHGRVLSSGGETEDNRNESACARIKRAHCW